VQWSAELPPDVPADRAESTGVGEPAVVHRSNGLVEGSYYHDPAAVLRYRNALTRLHNLALDQEESRIRRRAEELS
jgi:hypothetical protein